MNTRIGSNNTIKNISQNYDAGDISHIYGLPYHFYGPHMLPLCHSAGYCLLIFKKNFTLSVLALCLDSRIEGALSFWFTWEVADG